MLKVYWNDSGIRDKPNTLKLVLINLTYDDIYIHSKDTFNSKNVGQYIIHHRLYDEIRSHNGTSYKKDFAIKFDMDRFITEEFQHSKLFGPFDFSIYLFCDSNINFNDLEYFKIEYNEHIYEQKITDYSNDKIFHIGNIIDNKFIDTFNCMSPKLFENTMKHILKEKYNKKFKCSYKQINNIM